jgi:hypothetical protein
MKTTCRRMAFVLAAAIVLCLAVKAALAYNPAVDTAGPLRARIEGPSLYWQSLSVPTTLGSIKRFAAQREVCFRISARPGGEPWQRIVDILRNAFRTAPSKGGALTCSYRISGLQPAVFPRF